MRFSIRVSAAAALVALVALAQTASAATPVSLPIGTPTIGNLGLQLPWVVTGGATVSGPTTAKLTGTVDSNGLATNSYFEYGEGDVLDMTTPQDSVGAGLDAAKVATDVVGLQPSTNYSYRIVAENASGTSTGTTDTLTTRSASSSQAPSKAKARARCRVPRLRARPVKAAKRAIRRGHCKVGKIKKGAIEARQTRTRRLSIAQGGTKRAKGAKVRMTVRR